MALARWQRGNTAHCLPSVAAQTTIGFVYSLQRFLLQRILVLILVVGNAIDAHRDINKFSPLITPLAGHVVVVIVVVNTPRRRLLILNRKIRIVVKKLSYSRRRNNVSVAAKQTAVAGAMPEAPTQADVLFAAEDDLAAHLADGQVDDATEAGVAGQAGGAADGTGRAAR